MVISKPMLAQRDVHLVNVTTVEWSYKFFTLDVSELLPFCSSVYVTLMASRRDKKVRETARKERESLARIDIFNFAPSSPPDSYLLHQILITSVGSPSRLLRSAAAAHNKCYINPSPEPGTVVKSVEATWHVCNTVLKLSLGAHVCSHWKGQRMQRGVCKKKKKSDENFSFVCYCWL